MDVGSYNKFKAKLQITLFMFGQNSIQSSKFGFVFIPILYELYLFVAVKCFFYFKFFLIKKS